jgi:hypothetical protein
MRKFNRLHCDSTVRARFMGKSDNSHWNPRLRVYTIHIEGIRTVTETFVNGKLARKRFNELKRKP